MASKKDTYELPALASGSTSDDIDAEERLPLYEEHASGSAASALPDENATAAEVRGFIYHHLTARSGLDEAHARSISEKWTIGTGAELRSYPFSMYIDMFGAEAAWSIYRNVRMTVLMEKEPARLRKIRLTHGMCGGALVFCILGAIISGMNRLVAATVIFILLAVVIGPTWGILSDKYSGSAKTKLGKELNSASYDIRNNNSRES